MKPFVRSAYNYDMNEASELSGLKCMDPTMAQQQFKDEVDINTIVERFGLTGEVPTLTKLPSYGDYSGIFDYQTAMNAVVDADRQFMSLPHPIRTRFENDPRQFVDFFSKEENREEAIRLKLIPKPVDAAPQEPQVTEKKGKTPKTPDVTQ